MIVLEPSLTIKNFPFETGVTPDHFFKSGHTFLWLYFIISFGHMPTEMCEGFFDAPTMRGFYAGYKRWWNWGTLPQMMVQSCHIEIALYFGWIHLNLKKLELWKVILKSLQTIQVWNSTKVFNQNDVAHEPTLRLIYMWRISQERYVLKH